MKRERPPTPTTQLSVIPGPRVAPAGAARPGQATSRGPMHSIYRGEAARPEPRRRRLRATLYWITVCMGGRDLRPAMTVGGGSNGGSEPG